MNKNKLEELTSKIESCVRDGLRLYIQYGVSEDVFKAITGVLADKHKIVFLGNYDYIKTSETVKVYGEVFEGVESIIEKSNIIVSDSSWLDRRVVEVKENFNEYASIYNFQGTIIVKDVMYTRHTNPNGSLKLRQKDSSSNLELLETNEHGNTVIWEE